MLPFNLNIVQLEQHSKARLKKNEENLQLSAFPLALISTVSFELAEQINSEILALEREHLQLG